MKNKLLIVLLITLFLSFTSCAKNNGNQDQEPQGHEHNFCITECDDEYHWKKCSYEGCTKTSEKSEHNLSDYGCDDEYHWQKCSFDGCTKTGEKTLHAFDYSKKTIIEGNVNTYSYIRTVCDECGCISDIKCANRYRFDASINNWFRYRVVEVLTDYVIVNWNSMLLIDEFYTPEALIEVSKKYAVLKLEVLETYNEYIVNAKSIEPYSDIDSDIYLFMLVPMHLLDYYTRCDEYIAPLTEFDLSLYYDQNFVDYSVESLGYEDDSGYIQFKRQKYSSRYFDINSYVYIPYYEYNYRYGGLDIFFKSANSLNVLPVVDGKIDYSLYSEEEKELFFNIDDKHSPKDTIYRYLNVYVDEEHKFTFDYTLEELRIWLQEYSQYLYEAEQKFIEEDGKLFIFPGCGKPGYY